MLFADDVVVCAEMAEEVKERLEMWRKSMEERAMKVSRQKTEYLRLTTIERNPGEEVKLKLQGQVVKRVDEFKYQGSTVQADGTK